MKNRSIYKMVLLFLVALFCLPVISGSAMQLSVGREVFDTYGITMILPLDGNIDVASTDYYFEDEDDALPGLHGGVDMICALDTPVRAVYGGTVYSAGWSSSYGNTVVLRHALPSGLVFYSRYAHLNSYPVATGNAVVQGDVIGYAGSTGVSYVNHLHFELYVSESAGIYERSYTLKYLLSLGAEELSRMSFYYQPVEGEYNSQPRVSVLGSGGSCSSRCSLGYEHNHISRYAEYIKAFYERSPYSWNCRMYYDVQAENALFGTGELRERIYNSADINGDGHLSYYEVMSVTTLDLRGLGVSTFDGIELFGNLSSVLTDDASDTPTDPEPVYKLSVNYRLPLDSTNLGGGAGLWHHTDTTSKLWLRSGPSTSYERVGYLPPDVTFRVSATSWCGTYTWGKTTYGGVEGWCALDPSWASQLTSGYGTYTTDSEGYLIYTDTGARVVSELDSTMSCASLFDCELIDFISEGYALVGWTYDFVTLSENDMPVTELIPALSEGDVSVTLTGYIRYSYDMGDVDGSGSIDESDLMLMLRYVSGHRDAIVFADALDLTSDGKVNNRDLIALRRLIQ